MYIRKIPGNRHVVLPDGRLLGRADLPPPGTQRWVASRKALVVAAVDAGLVSADEAVAIWGLSPEELDGWRDAMARHGIRALRATALQSYRQPGSPAAGMGGGPGARSVENPYDRVT